MKAQSWTWGMDAGDVTSVKIDADPSLSYLGGSLSHPSGASDNDYYFSFK